MSKSVQVYMANPPAKKSKMATHDEDEADCANFCDVVFEQNEANQKIFDTFSHLFSENQTGTKVVLTEGMKTLFQQVWRVAKKKRK